MAIIKKRTTNTGEDVWKKELLLICIPMFFCGVIHNSQIMGLAYVPING
jgi:hypothetical protein